MALRDELLKRVMGVDLQEVQAAFDNQELENEYLIERLAALELALEDANWMKLMVDGDQEFSRDGLRQISELSRLMFLKNPLVKRGVMVQALYVWAQGMTVRAKDKRINAVVQAFWDDKKNLAELTGHQAQMYKEIDLQTSGNIFFVFFTRPSDGRVRVRSINPDEIEKVVCDPEDAKSPRYYLRVWTTREVNPSSGRMKTYRHKAYYSDWQYKPTTKAKNIGKVPIRWKEPVYHVKVGGFSDWKFGLSEVYDAIDWARAYKNFLEDVASLMRSYSRFAWKMTMRKGNKRGVSNAKTKLTSTLGNSGTSAETNPSPTAGSAYIGTGDMDMQPMQLRGASISPEDGRRFLLMVASSFGLPETFFGDVSVGTLATGKTLDRPTELMMRNRQEFWTEVIRNILDYVILQSVKAKGGKLGKEVGSLKVDTYNGQTEESVDWGKTNSLLDIDFPPVLERDIQKSVQAITTAATMNGQQLAIFDEPTVARLLLTALAQDDVDEIMGDLYPDESSGKKLPPTPAAEAIKAAIDDLMEAIHASSD